MSLVWTVDIIGSSLMIILNLYAVKLTREIYIKKRDIALYSYLYAQTIALAIFTLSRSIGHILKRILITADQPEIWQALSPVSGSINSLTFVGFGLIALFYSNVRATSEKVDALEKKEKELRESEEKYRTLVEDLPDMIYSLNDRGEFISINTTGLNLLGYSNEEIIGAHFSKVVFKEDFDKDAKFFKELLEHKKETTRESELRLQTKTGDIICTELNARARYGGDGMLIRTEGVVRDITELKKVESLQLGRNMVLEKLAMGASLEEVLSGLVEISEKNNPGMFCSVLLLDKEKKHLLYGAASSLPDFYNEAIHGLEIGPGVGSCGTAAYTGKRVIVEDIMTHPYWGAFKELAKKAGLRACWSEPIVSSSDQVLGTFALYYREPRTPDSSDLEFIKSTSHLAGIAIEKKQTEEALQRAHDGLEIKVAERTRELARANIQLKEMDRLKSEFLATMSHELRTPLNSIIGFVGIILQGIAGEINDEQKKQLSMVYSSARHLLSLINDILDLSRIESGKMEISLTRFKFEEIVSEVTQTLSPVISQKDLRLVTEMPDESPEIYSDRQKVLQILLNLVNNAVKFTNEGEIKIDCTIDNHNLEVSVFDTGIGIKKEKMDHLFEAFRQVDGTAQRRYQGTGLGLYLSRKLASLLGGKIWAESQYGKGSRFTLALAVSPRERSAT
jgi:PAS domain S-box-containing protein